MKNNKIKTVILSLIVMAIWGSLFPFIKIGYRSFGIDAGNTSEILAFAGARFTVCGIIISAIAFFKRDKIAEPKTKNLAVFALIGVFSIILHYAFTYIGLSLTDSSKTAIIKQLGSLLYVCFAFVFIKEEKFSVWKLAGAIIGFLGIIAINFGGGGISFSFGDLLIIAASVCTVASGVVSKRALKDNSPFVLTGVSQLFGGVVLVMVSVISGAKCLEFNLYSTAVFAYICTASIASYLLWNYVLKTSELSNLFIIKFAEPLFACVFGAALLGEDVLKWQYAAAFIFVSLGILLGNKTTAKSEK